MQHHVAAQNISDSWISDFWIKDVHEILYLTFIYSFVCVVHISVRVHVVLVCLQCPRIYVESSSLDVFLNPISTLCETAFLTELRACQFSQKAPGIYFYLLSSGVTGAYSHDFVHEYWDSGLSYSRLNNKC